VFLGTPMYLTKHAAGRVWLDSLRGPTAMVAWRTGDGSYRNIGDAPAGADLIEPTIEDAYLLMVGDTALDGASR
jgi:ABC-2 type transport system ATP-binding protein